jgi:hypothetical protein
MSEPLTMRALAAIADIYSGGGVPVEARLAPASMGLLRSLVEPDPTKWAPAPRGASSFFGIRLIVDPEVPDRRVEFRDRYGDVCRVIDL